MLLMAWASLQLFRPALLMGDFFIPGSRAALAASSPPYPPSPVITDLEWAPADTIVRVALNSDAWNLTWGDDDKQYASYGDGRGFEPGVSEKLSLGFAVVTGPADNFSGVNLRSPDEQKGDGASGKKGSGLLMIDGVIYMWVINANNAGEQCQLAWSNDRAVNWTWGSWKLAEFGFCTFINYGKNYAGARDNYVYSVSHDHPSAYQAADDFILMRVPKDQITNRSAYEFLKEIDNQGNPVWTADIGQRGAVFTHPGLARRSGISYNAAIGRYLWWQGFPHSGDERQSGGFGVFDAPEPWGPWTTVYYTENWDVGPGESAHFPTKWMSADRKTIYLVSSGNDSFSVRKANLTVIEQPDATATATRTRTPTPTGTASPTGTPIRTGTPTRTGTPAETVLAATATGTATGTASSTTKPGNTGTPVPSKETVQPTPPDFDHLRFLPVVISQKNGAAAASLKTVAHRNWIEVVRDFIFRVFVPVTLRKDQPPPVLTRVATAEITGTLVPPTGTRAPALTRTVPVQFTQAWTVTTTLTFVPTKTQTATATLTPTFTQTATSTLTPTLTLTPTATSTPTETPTPTNTSTPTITPTPTPIDMNVWPLSTWYTAPPAEMGMDEARLIEARDYALTGGGSGYITRHGRLVMSWGSDTQRYDLKSTTKSIGVTALGLALMDNRLQLEDRAQSYHPTLGIPPQENATTGWLDDITFQHLATHTAGFDKDGGYTNLFFAPGTKWSYSDGGANWLADCLTLVFGQDLNSVLFSRVFTPLGITSSDLTWRSNAYREDTINGIKRREFGSGISADIDALARIGFLFLRQGQWNGQQLLPQSFVEAAGTAVTGVIGLPELNPSQYFNASDHYGLLWWNNADGTLANVPRDAFWAWGLGDSLIIVIPSLDIVATRAGEGWQVGWKPDYNVLKPFLEPIVLSVQN